MTEKFQNKKGFTLVEMLIVVAIIAILIAIAIPIISATLERAREAVDDGNWRSAISLGNAYYLTETNEATRATFVNGTWRYFDINSNKEGYIMAAKAVPTKGYGEGTKIGDVKVDLTGAVLAVFIKNPESDAEPAVPAVWVAKPESGDTELNGKDAVTGIKYNPATAKADGTSGGLYS